MASWLDRIEIENKRQKEAEANRKRDIDLIQGNADLVWSNLIHELNTKVREFMGRYPDKTVVGTPGDFSGGGCV